MRMVCCRQIDGAEARFMPTMAARFGSMRRGADTSPSRATRHNPVRGIVDKRVPGTSRGALPRPAQWPLLRHAVQRRGGWGAGPGPQAHVLGDEAGSAPLGRVCTGNLHLADTGIDRHGRCSDRPGCPGRRCPWGDVGEGNSTFIQCIRVCIRQLFSALFKNGGRVMIPACISGE